MLDVSRKDLIAGVAGSGTMGRGIIQVLAQCGVRVLVYDAKAGAAQAGKDSIAQSLAKLVEKGRVKQKDADATLGRIELVGELKALSACHLVVEAIIEVLEWDLGRPVVSANQASLWHCLRRAGVREAVAGYGGLLRG